MKPTTLFRLTIATLSTAACLSGALLLTSRSASASNPFVNQISAQLIEAAVRAGFVNYQPTHDPLIDTLYDGNSKVHSLTLTSGVSYGLVGVCDEDCTDIDLKLYDENGNLVASDMAADDVPTVGVTPRWNGQFYLEVDMANCQASYCYYGVGVFGQ